MSKMSEKAVDRLNELVDQGKITLAPGDIWIPRDDNEFPNPATCIHTWRTVTLFTSTVEECSKCGALRE